MLTVDLERARVAPDQRVLDVGSGAGRHAFACLKAGAHVVALDRASDELAAVVEMAAAMVAAGEVAGDAAATVVRGEAGALPFADASFDRVIASEVLEHLPDDTAAIEELVRVVKPGGLVAISVPRAGPERLNWALSAAYHEVDGGHVRIYRRRQLVAACEGAGLDLVARHHAHALHSPYWWLRCLVGVGRDDHLLVRAYHRLLVWEIVRQPRSARLVERVLAPLIGKSLVVYFAKATP